ncbi:MAG: hypothetical protein QM750_19940 [Rubrivivax sp.]
MSSNTPTVSPTVDSGHSGAVFTLRDTTHGVVDVGEDVWRYIHRVGGRFVHFAQHNGFAVHPHPLPGDPSEVHDLIEAIRQEVNRPQART